MFDYEIANINIAINDPSKKLEDGDPSAFAWHLC